MRTKLSRLKKDISLLKQKLHYCREVLHDKEITKADTLSIADTAPPPINLSKITLSEELLSATTNL